MKNIILTAFLLISLNLHSQKILHPYNLDFEDGELDRIPVGWIHPTVSIKNGYNAKLTDFKPQHGKYCFELSNDSTYKEGIYGSVMQSIEAKPFRGKKIKLRAAVRAEISSAKGSAHLWLRVKLKDDEDGNLNLGEHNTIILGNWQFYETEVEVNQDAEQINYGLLLKGTGKAWLDNCSISIVDEIEESKNFEKIILNEEHKKELLAYSYIYGDMRYFHPTTEAMKLDWDKFSIFGVKTILESKTDFSKKINNIFDYIAPTLELFNSSEIPQVKYKLPENAIDRVSISYLRFLKSYNEVYDSKPINVFLPQNESEGSVIQVINLEKIKIDKLTFKCKVKYIGDSFNSFVQVLLRFDDENNKTIKFVSFDNDKKLPKNWQNVQFSTEVPENTKLLRVGLSLAGDGEAYFDNISITAYDGASEQNIAVKNNSFEQDAPGAKTIKSWKLAAASEKAGYFVNVIKEGDENVLVIKSDENQRLKLPVPYQFYQKELKTLGLHYRFMISLPMDSSRTLPLPKKEYSELVSKLNSIEFKLSDYNSRIAAFINIWNYLRNLSIANIKFDLLDNQFNSLIEKVAKSSSKEEFIEILNELIAITNDSQARVWYKNDEKKYALPFLIRKIGDNFIITTSKVESIKFGSKITSINGINVNDYFANRIKYYSGNNPEYKYLRAIADFRAGNENDKVKIGIENKEYEFSKNILLSELSEYRPNPISLIDSSIYYIDLTRLSDDELKANLKIFLNPKKVIFDLRGIAKISDHFLGFFLKSNVKSLEWLLPGFTFPEKQNINYKIITNEIKARDIIRDKCVFWIDDRTIGYSEAIVTLIKKYNIGKIIGLPSAGSIGESIPIMYFNSINISLTGLKVLNDKNDITFSIVNPDFNIKNNIEINQEQTFSLLIKSKEYFDKMQGSDK